MHHQRCQNRKQDDIASQFGDRFKCVHDGSIDHMAERMAECLCRRRIRGDSGITTVRPEDQTEISEVRYKERYKMKKVYPEA